VYAVLKSVVAVVSKPGLLTDPAGPAASTAYIVPITAPGGKPVIAAPVVGLNPTSPVTTVEPVLVTAEYARTANAAAVPNDGEVAAETSLTAIVNAARIRRAETRIVPTRFLFIIISLAESGQFAKLVG
jgi:hypothetical protein